MRAHLVKLILAAALAGFFSTPPPAVGSEELDELKHELEDMRKQMTVLNDRLARLEALKPTFVDLMPDFSERFHVMHFSGFAGDWAVARHELNELNRMVKVFKIIDPERGAMLEGFIGGNLHTLESIIDHGDRHKFEEVLKETVVNCNACHKAVGAESMMVALDPAPILSMRHSHRLKESDVDHAHTH